MIAERFAGDLEALVAAGRETGVSVEEMTALLRGALDALLPVPITRIVKPWEAPTPPPPKTPIVISRHRRWRTRAEHPGRL